MVAALMEEGEGEPEDDDVGGLLGARVCVDDLAAERAQLLGAPELVKGVECSVAEREESPVSRCVAVTRSNRAG